MATKRSSGPLAALDPDVKRAGAAVAVGGILKPDDLRTKFRQPEPHRHLALEHAALARPVAALAGDHQNDSRAALLAGPEKPQQGVMRFGLRESVQIEPAAN